MLSMLVINFSEYVFLIVSRKKDLIFHANDNLYEMSNPICSANLERNVKSYFLRKIRKILSVGKCSLQSC